MPERAGFYERVLSALLADGVLRCDMSVLVTCGGTTDYEVLRRLGFERVTITNLDSSGEGNRYAPYAWGWQDAERLTVDDESFDVGLVSAGLHHCHSPHRALLELYRTARVAVVALEARDRTLMRLASRLGLTDDYELSAVAHHNLEAGGVANSATPNFVYRWTEREVEKTIASYAPHARARLRYFHEFELPSSRCDVERSSRRSQMLSLARPLAAGLVRVMPSQSNLFGIVIEKPRLPEDLQPWMTLVDSTPNRTPP